MTSRGRWLLVGALLTPAVVLPLWVSLYDREEPTLAGLPFFYWFQILLIVVAVALTVPAYLVSRQAERLDRVRHGLPPDPSEPTGAGTPDAGGR